MLLTKKFVKLEKHGNWIFNFFNLLQNYVTATFRKKFYCSVKLSLSKSLSNLQNPWNFSFCEFFYDLFKANLKKTFVYFDLSQTTSLPPSKSEHVEPLINLSLLSWKVNTFSFRDKVPSCVYVTSHGSASSKEKEKREENVKRFSSPW